MTTHDTAADDDDFPGSTNYGPGHHIHPIQAKLAARHSGSWRDGTLMNVEVDAHVLVVEYPDGAQSRFWRANPVDSYTTWVGQSVRTSERWSVIEMGSWLSVKMLQGQPRRPADDEDDVDSQQPGIIPPIVDMARGEAIPIDLQP